MYQMDPTETFETAQDKDAWEDVISRSVMAANLILGSFCIPDI